MKRFSKLFLASIVTMVAVETLSARDVDNHWYIGFGGGIHESQLMYSNLDKDYFPKNEWNLSGVFSVFAEFDFGKNNMFAVRPQLSFLTRGGRLSQIGKDYYDGYFADPSQPSKLLNDVRYTLKAQCFDVRLPLIWQMGKAGWKFRPYIYVAPIFSVVNNGYVSACNLYENGAFDGYRFKVSDANMASCMFSGAVGIGCKYTFDISGNPFFIGLEAGYEHTFTNTYGSKEKKGEADVISFFPNVKNTEGARRLQGVEVQMTLGIPLSVFQKKKAVPRVIETVYEPVVIEQEEEVVMSEPECYSLDEMINLINAGRNVDGKKICAIDEINFDFAKSDVHKSSYNYLNKLADFIKRTNSNVIVNGHTDNVGTPEFNLELSRKRAVAVRDYLIKRGVDKTKVTYRYYGMTRPLTDNETEDGRKMNRRVEFEISK